MSKKLFEVEVPVHWEIVKGERPETIMLRLRHKSLAAVKAEGIQGGTTVLLAFSREMATDLANDLLGMTAAAPRPERFDS
jgi:hypothetical protein